MRWISVEKHLWGSLGLTRLALKKKKKKKKTKKIVVVVVVGGGGGGAAAAFNKGHKVWGKTCF
jgi:hypothetical protein